MNESRKALADLFARLHGMGVESAAPMPLCSIPAPLCGTCETWWTANKERKVGEVVGEMFGRDNQGITESDVLAAAKRAGVY